LPTGAISLRHRGAIAIPLLLAAMLGCATPAAAQFSGSLAIRTDDRFRGRSLSQGRPTMALNLSYDHPTGLYLDVVVRGMLARHEGPQLLSVEENFGFAKQIRPNLSIDVGVTNSDYTKYYNGLRSAHYQEFYVGVITKEISAHLHYSPRYFGIDDYSTLYGGLDGAVPLTERWRLTAHVGVLQQVGGRTLGTSGRTHFDYRLGAAVRFGPIDLLVEWTGGGPGRDFYAHKYHSKNAVVAGANLSF
jgi:uncharacterized protein (TIGR02001 family)